MESLACKRLFPSPIYFGDSAVRTLQKDCLHLSPIPRNGKPLARATTLTYQRRGEASMVDVSAKPVLLREAAAHAAKSG